MRGKRTIFASMRVAACAWAAASPCIAQMYAFDPKNPPANAVANVYFGSTKDRSGRFLEDVTVQLEIGQVTYVVVTDDAGRFKILVPKEATPAMVKFSCSRPGYRQVSATKRLPPGKGSTPIQADCVLEPGSGR